MIEFRKLRKEEISVSAEIRQVNEDTQSCTFLLHSRGNAVSRILNESCGLNWKSESAPVCTDAGIFFRYTLSVRDPESGEWVSRSDCGELIRDYSRQSPKQAETDAFKRAAMRFGVADELWTAPEMRIPCLAGQLTVVTAGSGLYTTDILEVGDISYDEFGCISALTIVNRTLGCTVCRAGYTETDSMDETPVCENQQEKQLHCVQPEQGRPVNRVEGPRELSLTEALAFVIPDTVTSKYKGGLTLSHVRAVEPGYVDWLISRIPRYEKKPELAGFVTALRRLQQEKAA